MLKSIFNLVSHISTERLALLLAILGGICFFSMQPVSSANANDTFQNLLFSAGSFFWGIIGIPLVIRKRGNFGFYRLEGWPAVLCGLFISFVFFSMALLPLLPRIK